MGTADCGLRSSTTFDDTHILPSVSLRSMIPVSELQAYLKLDRSTIDKLLKKQSKRSTNLDPSLQVPKCIRTPTDFAIPERLLYDVDVYLRGPFESGRWSIVGNKGFLQDSSHQYIQSEIVDLEAFIFSALSVSASRDIVRASRAWAHVSEEISSVIPKQNIHTYTRLSFLTRTLILEGKVEIAHAILRQFHGLTTAREGAAQPNHPLLNLYNGLLRANPADIDQIVPLLQFRVAEILDSLLGTTDLESLSQRGLLSMHIQHQRISLQHSGGLIKRCMGSDLSSSRHLLIAMWQHLQNLLNRREYTLLIGETTFWLKYLQDIQHIFHFQEHFYLWSCSAMCHDMLGEIEMARKAYQLALEIARKTVHIQPRPVVTYLRWFETNWKVHGNQSYAAEIRELRYQAEDNVLRQLDEKWVQDIAV